jgi:hypothetical protein
VISFNREQVAGATCSRIESPRARNIREDRRATETLLVPGRTKQGDSLREINIRDGMCGLMVMIAGFGLYSYYFRELLAALTLFSVAFFFIALLGLGALLVWFASVQVAIWATPASRSMIAFSRRLIAARARP